MRQALWAVPPCFLEPRVPEVRPGTMEGNSELGRRGAIRGPPWRLGETD